MTLLKLPGFLGLASKGLWPSGTKVDPALREGASPRGRSLVLIVDGDWIDAVTGEPQHLHAEQPMLIDADTMEITDSGLFKLTIRPVSR